MSTVQDTRETGFTAPPSRVRIERIFDCPFSFCLEHAPLVFEMLRAPGPGVRLPLRDFGLPFAGALTHRVTTQFQLQPDLTERGRMHDEVDFNWRAGSLWLPDFHGVLRMRIENLQTRVVLHGDYVVPFGAFGATFDRLIGRRLARASAADIVERLATELESRWAAERRLG